MTPTRFRLLIALYLATVVCAIGGHVLTAAQLPPPLRGFVHVADGTTWMAHWPGAVYLAAATASTIGLILFRSWARPVFTVVAVFGAMPWDGPVVYPAMEYLFTNLEFMLAGAIVALAYFSPIHSSFNGKIAD
jgi:hypothetical protein